MAQIPNPAPGAKRLTQVLMGGAGLILLGGGGALFGLNSRLTGLEGQARQKEQEVGSSEQVTRRYQETQTAYDETQSRIKFLETSVSAKSYVPTLLGQLQTLAAQTRLSVTAVRPSAPVAPAPPARKADGDGAAKDADKDAKPEAKKAAPPPYDTLAIDVDVSGTYADTASFLYGLTRFPKILSVAGVQMHPGTAAANAPAGAAPVITTNLKLVAFVFPNDAAAPAQAAAAPDSAGAKVTGADLTPAAVGAIYPAAGHAAAAAAGAARAVKGRNDQGMGAL